MRKLQILISLLVLFGFPLAGIADSRSPIMLKYGPNSVDFTGDGVADLLVFSHRENFNAHSFNVASFYIVVDPGNGGKKEWNIVPIMKNDRDVHEVTAGGGADCLLRDFRIIPGSDKTAPLLILAKRDLGTSFADACIVNFTFFSLETNEEGLPGFPLYYFKQMSVTQSKNKYCDVGNAFEKELGIGPYTQ